MRARSYALVAWFWFFAAHSSEELAAQGLPTQSWPAGSFLSSWNHGGRIVTWHRGQLYLGGFDGQGSHVYDLSNPVAPQWLCSSAADGNSHAWQKIGDLFYRQYFNPEVGADPPPGVSQFVSLAEPCNRVPWTTPIPGFPHLTRVWGGAFIDTFPYYYGPQIFDARIGWQPPVADISVNQMANLPHGNRWRLGNLLFLTPGDEETGLAIFDIGNPLQPVLLSVLRGNYRQYTSAWHIWEHYLVLMNGDDGNGPPGQPQGNGLVIDIADPSNPTLVRVIPHQDLPGRYVYFQDDYAFAGRFARGTKYNLRSGQVERVFTPPSDQGFGDYQWIPLGHLLLISESQPNGSRSFLYTHQDGLDITPPRVGYHLPTDGATQVPLTSAIGLVINETLDASTVNAQNIELRAIGGSLVETVIIHTSYQVVNIYPTQPLQADTNYEFRLRAGGVRDIAGNAVGEFRFQFSTGTGGGGGSPQIQSVGVQPGSPVLRGQSLQFQVSASGATEYRWDFGSGAGPGPWSVQSSANHAYAQAGTYVATVQARNASGAVASATTTLVVRQPDSGSTRSSSGLLALSARREIWSVLPDHGGVARVHADQLQRIGEVMVGNEPVSLAARADGQIWVVNRGSDNLSRVDPQSGNVLQTLNLDYGDRPGAIVIDGNDRAYVSLNGTGEVLRFDAATGGGQQRLFVGADPQALAIDGNGSHLYVSRMRSGADAGMIWRIALPAFAAAVPVTLPIDSSTVDSGTAARGIPNYVASLVIAPDATRLWYGAKKDNILRGRYRDGQALNFETTVRSLVGSLDLSGSAHELVNERVDLDNNGRAAALWLSPGASHLAVALEANDRVLVIDPWQRTIQAQLAVGAAPRDLILDPQTQRLFVRNDLGRSLSVFGLDALLDRGESAGASLATIALSTSEPLSPSVLAGKQIFTSAADTRMAADGYLSCAACHLDGGSDGRSWDFSQLGEGLRNTTSLRGGGAPGSGLLHWSGNFDEVQDFETPIRDLFGGIGFLDDAVYFANGRAHPLGPPKAGLNGDLDALAAYVGSLQSSGRSPHRNPDGSLSTDGAAGRQLFQQLGCQRCHAGTQFSDSHTRQLHDVGSLGPASGQRLGTPLLGLDTPTLRGLWAHPPYLHDGAAADLTDVLLTRNAAGNHGDVASLNTTQRNQLFAFLMQIDDNEPGMQASATLQLASPAAGSSHDPGSTVTLSISTNLPTLSRVDYYADGVLIASADLPPWSASWQVSAGGDIELRAKAWHDGGRYNTISPALQIHAGCQATGQIRYQRWDGISGRRISDLRAHPSFPDTPDHSSLLEQQLDIPRNIGDQYGARLIGRLCAPASGDYRFYVAGDDNVELWLGTGAEAATAQRIAFHNDYTNPEEWTRFPSQQSSSIPLLAGRWYYLEALVKEDGGDDHLSIGWQRPDGSLERPLSAVYFDDLPPAAPLPEVLFGDGFEK